MWDKKNIFVHSQYKQWPSDLKGVGKPQMFKIGYQRTIGTNMVVGTTNGYWDTMEGSYCTFNKKNKVRGEYIRKKPDITYPDKESTVHAWAWGGSNFTSSQAPEEG